MGVEKGIGGMKEGSGCGGCGGGDVGVVNVVVVVVDIGGKGDSVKRRGRDDVEVCREAEAVSEA